ncbi:zinc ribbon domain-containing protein [Limnoglobus roseus]|uniref:Zinc finger/thioredoxin putative domain-containing protein n=1 Tax=Limnoglobus roseus TaxID=2598579 RepID=A0A5C1AE96_9BACT|nr:hypothetical protein [Limnoglobus roseus]QEL16517.1 hypothetical protein PX52LOC_03476 [Limnoglobus roseus]
MPITVTCPKCREALDIPNELLGGEVRCGSCQEIFVAHAPGDAPPPLPDEDRPRRPRRKRPDVSRNKPLPTSRADDDYGPLEYDPDRKRKQGVGVALWVLFGVFGLLGCTCCGVIGYFVVQTMDPEYKEFKAPDGRFTAEFPSDVKQKTRVTGRDKDKPAVSFEAERKMVQENYFIYYVDLTDAEKRDSAKVIDGLCDGLIKTNQGKEISRSKRAHQGFEAADVILSMPGKRFIQARAIVGDGRGYVVGVAVNGEPQGMIWLEHFFENFEITAPDKKKDDKKKPEKKDGKKPEKKPVPDDDDDN